MLHLHGAFYNICTFVASCEVLQNSVKRTGREVAESTSYLMSLDRAVIPVASFQERTSRSCGVMCFYLRRLRSITYRFGLTPVKADPTVQEVSPRTVTRHNNQHNRTGRHCIHVHNKAAHIVDYF